MLNEYTISPMRLSAWRAVPGLTDDDDDDDPPSAA
jgi:hypothetical protein